MSPPSPPRGSWKLAFVSGFWGQRALPPDPHRGSAPGPHRGTSVPTPSFVLRSKFLAMPLATITRKALHEDHEVTKTWHFISNIWLTCGNIVLILWHHILYWYIFQTLPSSCTAMIDISYTRTRTKVILWMRRELKRLNAHKLNKSYRTAKTISWTKIFSNVKTHQNVKLKISLSKFSILLASSTTIVRQ